MALNPKEQLGFPPLSLPPASPLLRAFCSCSSTLHCSRHHVLSVRLRWASTRLQYVQSRHQPNPHRPNSTPRSLARLIWLTQSSHEGNPTVDLATLSLPQLRALQSRLTSELEHLTSSHTKLRAAQAKFRECVRSITDGVTGSEKQGTKGQDEILVPLTSSLYVKGRLTDREKVLVDVGTGFYVEKVWKPSRFFTTEGWNTDTKVFRHRKRPSHFTMKRCRAWMPTYKR